MKISFVILLACSLSLSATGLSQNNKVSVIAKNATLLEIFEQIEASSDYGFLFEDDQIDLLKTYSIDVTDEAITEVLNKLLDEKEYRFTVVENNIVIRKVIESTASANQQENITVAGTVTDHVGEPLPGVSIVIKGTATGTITSIDGSYKLPNIEEGTTLVFSFIGFESQEVQVAGRANINITMVEETTGLDEVVVVGYGSSVKRKVVSSVSTIATEDIENIPVTTIVDGLAGRATGLFVNASGGEPGSVPSISIRGGGQPTYVIDGIQQGVNVFQALNPDDIASITVLKDAGATAVYGVKGANGIILVTTKSGESGDFKVSYNNNFGWSQSTVKPERPDAYTYAQMMNGLDKSMGRPERYTPDVMEKIRTGSDPDVYPDNDWYNEVVREFAPQQTHNLSLSGGNEISKFYMGLGAFSQGSTYKNDATTFDRYNYRLNVSSSFEKVGLTVAAGLDGYLTKKDGMPYSAYTVWSHMSGHTPLENIYNPDGTLAATSDHPLAEILSPGYNRNDQHFMNGNLRFVWEVPNVKGLSFTALGNYSKLNNNTKTFTVLADQFDANGNLMAKTSPSLHQNTHQHSTVDMEGHINYIRSFGDHNVEFTGVYSQSEASGYQFWASRRNYMSVVVDQLFAGDSDTKDNSGGGSESSRMGYVGRVKYDYKGKYIVEFSGRYDGSYKFDDGHRWGFFPSGSAGWIISDESFMQSLKDKHILDLFKLRYSYGIVGSDAVAEFAYLPTYSLIGSRYMIDGKLVNGYREGELTGNAYSWFEQESHDIGFDYATMNNKLSGTFAYFYYRKTGYVQDPKEQYVTPLGKSLPKINSDAASRKDGIEISAAYKNSYGDFKYEIGGNVSSFRTMWEKANESETALMNPNTRSTQRVNDAWGRGYTSNGLYQTNMDILNNQRRLSANALRPGDLMYQDLNGDGKIDDEDISYIGSAKTPQLTYGVFLNASYKGLSLSALIQGSGKRNMLLGWHARNDQFRYDHQKDFWTPDNTGALFPRPTLDGMNNSNNSQTSTHYLLDAQYVRLKSLSISYDLKKEVLKSADWLNSCSVFVSGYNLLTSSKASDFVDPETAHESNFGYPVNRTYSLGLKVAF
ncbi:TonB-dependent receptor [Carboxylicivirga marina]|nr:TonB-dependent receptor [Carboxylicivirga marina]